MNFVKKKLKWILAAFVILFALLQLANPAHTNPPVKTDFLATLNPPPKIAGMFRAACYDCHSNETRWPWYSHIMPMSWQIVQDVNDGRDNLNLSEWPTDNPKRAWKKMENMSEEIDGGDMPLKKYTLIHADARLTAEQRSDLTGWLDDEVDKMKAQAGQK
ncbi:MAG TPA: heme-binding domain-containing protein [Candidatus Acidoferrum sp.]|jgi:hypothetical protein|nr:heme-binding domain-containing protein [Candidatus Acidoferrum sp.]